MNALEQRHALMVKLRDDARERGMIHLAMMYGAQALRLSQEQIKEAAEKLGSSTKAQMRRD